MCWGTHHPFLVNVNRNKWTCIWIPKEWKQWRREEEKRKKGVRWTLALSERTANRSKNAPSLPNSSLEVRISRTHSEPVKMGSLNVSHQRTNSERAKKWNFAFYTILTRNLGFKRGKTEGARHSSLLGLLGELCGVLGHGYWWRLSWGLKFWRDLSFTSWFFFSILLPLLLFNVYDYYCIFPFRVIEHE